MKIRYYCSFPFVAVIWVMLGIIWSVSGICLFFLELSTSSFIVFCAGFLLFLYGVHILGNILRGIWLEGMVNKILDGYKPTATEQKRVVEITYGPFVGVFGGLSIENADRYFDVINSFKQMRVEGKNNVYLVQ